MLSRKIIFSAAVSLIMTAQTFSATASASTLQPSRILETYYTGFSDTTRKVETDFTPEYGEDGYFFVATNVQFGSGCEGICSAYAGLQTNGLINGTWVGKMAIFSLWDAPNAVPAENVQLVRFTGEGEGYSLRFPYDWQVGRTYRLSMEFTDSGQAQPALKANITDQQTGEKRDFGSITLPGNYDSPKLISTFHQYFGAGDADCSSKFPSAWRIERVTVDDSATILPATQQYTDAADKTPECKDLIWFNQTEKGARSAVGINKTNLSEIVQPEKISDADKTDFTVNNAAFVLLAAIVSIVLYGKFGRSKFK